MHEAKDYISLLQREFACFRQYIYTGGVHVGTGQICKIIYVLIHAPTIFKAVTN